MGSLKHSRSDQGDEIVYGQLGIRQDLRKSGPFNRLMRGDCQLLDTVCRLTMQADVATALSSTTQPARCNAASTAG